MRPILRNGLAKHEFSSRAIFQAVVAKLFQMRLLSGCICIVPVSYVDNFEAVCRNCCVSPLHYGLDWSFFSLRSDQPQSLIISYM